MTEISPTRLWLMRGGFALLTLTILFFALLPLDTQPRRWAGPDLLLAFACAWSLRRPEYVTAPILAACFLLADLLLQRPPGLQALMALAGCENLKARGRTIRDANFAAEWLTVALIMAAVLMGTRLILAITLVDVPSFGLFASELLMTILVYPIVAGITHFLMGVRAAAPGDLDAMGQRI